VERDDYLMKAAAFLKIEPDTLRAELVKYKRGRKKHEAKSESVVAPATVNAVESAALQILAIWSQHPDLMQASPARIDESDFPPQFKKVLDAVIVEKRHLSPTVLYEYFSEGRFRGLLGKLLFQDYFERDVAEKALEDCIRHLKCANITRKRKELEVRMANLDPVTAKGEINTLSKSWIELRRQEESLYRPREGGKVIG